MKLIASSTALRSSHSVRFMLLTVLTLIAMMFCLLSAASTLTHSSAAEHAMTATTATTATTAPAAATRPAAPAFFGPAPASASPGAAPTMRLAGAADQPTLCHASNSLGGAGVLASCGGSLAVISSALLAQLPTVSDLAIAPFEAVVDSSRAMPAHLHRPSLTLLSISRV
jgi:hypothetical protein